jgi:hypothetical protein
MCKGGKQSATWEGIKPGLAEYSTEYFFSHCCFIALQQLIRDKRPTHRQPLQSQIRNAISAVLQVAN